MEITISRKQRIILIDEADVAWLQNYYMYIDVCNGREYVKTYIKGKSRGVPKIYLHRLLTGAKPGQEVDHIDGNGLNNQRANLRICSRSTNMLNMKNPYRGVSLYKKTGRWAAYIKVNYVKQHLGYFSTFAEALAARQEAHTRLSGSRP